MDKIQKDFEIFMSDLESKLHSLDLQLDSYPIDHICFRASNIEDYQKYKDIFAELSNMYTSRFFNERTFHMFILKNPLTYKDIEISTIEFSQPGGSDSYPTGFQHIEFLTNKSLDQFGRSSEFLFKGKYGESYFKWPDKKAVKPTPKSSLTDMLSAEDTEIHI